MVVLPRVGLSRWLMDLHVPPELEANLNQLAKGTGRNPEEVALDLLATSVEYDEWFRREVEF